MNRAGAPCLSYVYNDEASAWKKYREMQKKYRGTHTMVFFIKPAQFSEE